MVIIHSAVMFILEFSAFHRIQFHVFQTWHTAAAFSSLTVSHPVIWSRLNFPVPHFPRWHCCIFDGAAFSILAFSVAPSMLASAAVN